MGRQIIKQPNGKYAIWSVDNFIYLNCTRQDIIDIYCQEYKEEIIKKVGSQIAQLEKGEKPYHQFTKSWDEALDTIANVHGKQVLDNFKKELQELGI